MPKNVKPKERALTPRGAATRRRIVKAAAKLIYVGGAERVSLDEVMEASGTSKSQLYHYFADKDQLVREVIEFQASHILQNNAAYLGRLDSFEALRAWRDAMIAANRAAGRVGGCPLGSLANELAARSEQARKMLDQSFQAWSAIIEAGLSRMKKSGHISAAADTKVIAVAVLAAIQGGLLLSKTARNPEPLKVAFDMALSHIERHAVSSPETRVRAR
jgi:TetR/AcrR family transcriptional regulator, transcriptional repressor for nem operon